MSAPPSSGLAAPSAAAGWVFDARTDLAVFLGPVLLSVAVAVGAAATGTLHADLPTWGFLAFVVACDVAHVWGTAFRAYLDPEVRRARGALLLVVPLACFACGALLHRASPEAFWRTLAYLAAFHFVRQPWGFLSYAARRAGETSRLDRRLDALAVHLAALHPLLWWHAHLPRRFVWFRPDDFAPGLASAVAEGAGLLLGLTLGVWVARQVVLRRRGVPFNRGKALVLFSTAFVWHFGIVALDSDVVFTVSNVVAHGVPYLVLVHRYGRRRWGAAGGLLGRVFAPGGAWLYGALLVAVAYVEEALWDAGVWHEHGTVFPLPFVALPVDALSLVVPLLAVPQATHYVLDAFLWRPSADPGLRATLFAGADPGGAAPAPPTRPPALGAVPP